MYAQREREVNLHWKRNHKKAVKSSEVMKEFFLSPWLFFPPPGKACERSFVALTRYTRYLSLNTPLKLFKPVADDNELLVDHLRREIRRRKSVVKPGAVAPRESKVDAMVQLYLVAICLGLDVE
jgi:hypothetical protein